MSTSLDYPSFDDARLVALHRAGDRAAFRQIVDRYKSMVCAVAYSACGDLARSEDLAQEVFVAAWKQIASLQEPAKLRGWLGGITRNVSHSFLRREGRLVSGHAEALSPDLPAEENDPRQQAITADDAALMWRALADLGEAYREPMVLFYREHRSISAVAETLGLSDDNVRQRLTRGRAMLSERMAAIVEETLERAAPTERLTNLVMLALPLTAAPLIGGGAVAAQSGGSAAVKGGLAVKALPLVGILPAVFQGLNDYLSFRARQAMVPPETQARAERLYFVMKGSIALLILALLAIGWNGPVISIHSSAQFFIYLLAIGLPALIGLKAKGELDRLIGKKEHGAVFEFCSRETFLGAPLVHLRVGGDKAWRRRRPVHGWIALSDSVSIGRLIAFGPVAIAPLSFGGLAIGGCALGALAVGGFATGWVAIGWMAEGAIGLGWLAARGGIAFAHEWAQGAIAVAPHVKDALTQAFFAESGFFKFSGHAWRYWFWGSWFAWLPPLVLTLWARRKAKRLSGA